MHLEARGRVIQHDATHEGAGQTHWPKLKRLRGAVWRLAAYIIA